jgi:outer membrane receptor protein involved in Fe transport
MKQFPRRATGFHRLALSVHLAVAAMCAGAAEPAGPGAPATPAADLPANEPAAAADALEPAAPVASVVVVGALASRSLAQQQVSSVYGTGVSLLDTPRAVSQISTEQLLRDGIRTADDLVKYAPGVTRNGGQNVSVAPLIRGQASELYQDGQRTYNVRHPFNTNAFEGVDIVAGPPPQVFGISSRSGGYANYLSKRPDFERQRAQISGQVGTWVPGGGSYDANALTADVTGPIDDTLAYRVSVTAQRADDYAEGVRNNFDAFYGALAWKPRAGLRVDWNLSVDNYYDFNVTHGWNRVTQQLIDDGAYQAGRATPIISVGTGAATRYYSPVFASGAYNSSVTGWQQRTPVTNAAGVRQFVAGPLLGAGQLPPFLSSQSTPGTVRGWVYDPTLAGNGVVTLSDSAYSRPQDQNKARRDASQLQLAWDLNESWSLHNSSLYQRSKDAGSSVGSFFTQIEDRIFENRLELRGKADYTLFGLHVHHDSNTGASYRRERYTTLAANNSFTINPYDLSAPLDLKTPATLLALPTPGGPGSWIGAAGGPQQSSAFGWLSLPAMYPAGGDYYAERGGSPAAGGATYTSDGRWTNLALFTQQNFLVDERWGLNVGLSGTRVDASIHNPVFVSAAQEVRDSKRFYLPAAQVSLLYKASADSTLYITHDRSYAINTGGFADVLTWGANNQLNPLNFRSLSRLLEVGAKADLIPGRLQGSIAAYRQKRDVAPLTDGSIPKLQVNGVDAALHLQVARDVSAGLNYSLINARYTYVSFPPGFFSPWGFVADNATVFADGNALNQRAAPGEAAAPGIPKHSLSGYVDLRFGHGYGAELAGWWTSDWATSLTRTAVVPNEHALNLTLYLRRPKWDVALRILNLTDERNFVNGLTGPTTEFLQPGIPRAVQATFAYRF